MTGEQAKEHIEENFQGQVHIVKEGSKVIANHNLNRVRIYVGENGKVSRAPKTGWSNIREKLNNFLQKFYFLFSYVKLILYNWIKGSFMGVDYRQVRIRIYVNKSGKVCK